MAKSVTKLISRIPSHFANVMCRLPIDRHGVAKHPRRNPHRSLLLRNYFEPEHLLRTHA